MSDPNSGLTTSFFKTDLQHASDDHRPASYTARSVLLYSCGGCGRGLEGGPKAAWPRYCSLGHKNERPEA